MNSKQKSLVATLIALTLSSSAFAQPADADFAGGVDDAFDVAWNAAGTVRRHVNNDTGNAFALFSEFDADGNAGPGFARLHQEQITLPASNYLTFRYRFETTNGLRRRDVPADAFIVRLYDSSGVHLPTTAVDSEPHRIDNFTQAVYYHDTYTDPSDRYDPTIVQRAGPDTDGFYSIAIDAAALGSSTDLTIEFGFVYADNGQQTTVAVDGILTDCPTGYCCSNSLLVMNQLDDGLICTADCCETIQDGNCPAECSSGAGCHPACGDAACSHTGVALHLPTPPPCDDVDLVFIIDTSCSMIEEAEAVCEAISALASNPANNHVRFDILVINNQGLNGNCGGSDDSVLDSLIANCPQTSVIDLQNDLENHLVISMSTDVPILMEPESDYTCSDSLTSPCSLTSQAENWGPAVAVVAEHYTWRASSPTRVIVPISDEAPCMGSDNCNLDSNLPASEFWCSVTHTECPDHVATQANMSCCGSDSSSVANAILVAMDQNPPVIVAPVISPINHVPEATCCVVAQAQALAAGTGGIAVNQSTATGAIDMTDITIDILISVCGCD